MQFSATAVPAVALLAMVQYCPAPFFAAIPAAVAAGMGAVGSVVGAAGAVTGAVEAGLASHGHKREVEFARDFNSRIKGRQDYGTGTAWSDCHSQLSSAKVTFSAPSTGSK